MNETIKIAAAAFMHDIGKLVQRIAADSREELPDDFSRQDYQPKSRYGKGLDHAHSSWTAYFIKKHLSSLPEIDDKDAFACLAAKHHLPANDLYPDEIIVQAADRISSGMDRQSVNDNEYSGTGYRKVRLMSIFDQLDGKVADYEGRRFQYDIAPLDADNPASVFPVSKNDSGPDYSTIGKEFYEEVYRLQAKSHKTLKKWLDEFCRINEKWTAFVPSSTVDLPDISLYDHALTSSAIAQALYAYHYEKGDLSVKSHIEANKNTEEKKFLFFKAKFNGIQNFIFSSGGQTNKNAAKILRGRSFYIAHIMKCLSRWICDDIGLAYTAQIMAAAGSITLLLPNTDAAKNILVKIEQEANKWLLNHFYGETSISFAYEEISAKDLGYKNKEDVASQKNDLAETGKIIAKKLEAAKYARLPANSFGIVQDYFKEGDSPCPYCGRRPVHVNHEKCDVCEDLASIGENIPKKKAYSLKVRIFDRYDMVGKEDYDSLYIPVDSAGTIKTFDEIVKNNDEKGIEALAVFKADVDNLGKLFRNVSEKGGISRQTTLSRMLDSFWTLWMPHELKSREEFRNIYTVFSGGDDLFLIGKWDEIIEFAMFLRDKFREFTCCSPCVSFSAGIALLKCGEPVQKFYELSEYALETSKLYVCGEKKKNAFTLFNETISWDNLQDFLNCDCRIKGLIEEKQINSAALQKIMEFISMADRADDINARIIRKETVSYSEMSCFKWKALLSYFISRNDAIKKQEQKQELINYLAFSINKKSSRSILKAAIWKNIYKNRTRRK